MDECIRLHAPLWGPAEYGKIATFSPDGSFVLSILLQLQQEVIYKCTQPDGSNTSSPALATLHGHATDLCNRLLERMSNGTMVTCPFIISLLEICGMDMYSAAEDILWDLIVRCPREGNQHLAPIMLRLRNGFEGIHPEVYKYVRPIIQSSFRKAGS